MGGNIIVKATVITAFWGNVDWLKQTIASVKAQDYENLNHLIIMDGPEYERSIQEDDTTRVIVRKERMGAVYNLYHAFKEVGYEFDNILIHLDGDDMFIGTDVVSRVMERYKTERVWSTYGNYVGRRKSVCRPPEIPPRKSIIQGGWRYSHLRTFRAHLGAHVKEEDMLDSKGDWYSAAYDTVIMCPIYEMAGLDRVKFIDEDLMYYREHSNNEHSNKEALRNQVRCAIEIYNKQPYKILT